MPRRRYYCKLCDYVGTTTEVFTNHVGEEHDMDILDYYDNYDIENIPFRLNRKLIKRSLKLEVLKKEPKIKIVYNNEIDSEHVKCPICNNIYIDLLIVT